MDFPFNTTPAPGQKLTVCDGIDWVRMPLPFALDHVNCWLLSDQVLIDTGVDNEHTRELWNEIFRAHNQWPEHLLVTHFHPDHMGLAGWISEQHNLDLSGSEIEVQISLLLHQTESEEYSRCYQQWYAQNGLPARVVEAVSQNGNTYARKVYVPPALDHWSFLSDGQYLDLGGRQYRVIVGRGHAPDMLMLYREDDHVLIAADQVLPGITPNVSVMPKLADANPLQSFLYSLTRLEDLPDDTLVLPSHGLPFRGLKERLSYLKQHHELRLDEIAQACHEPRSAFDLFSVLFSRKLDAQQMSFALGETLAHLHYLEELGRMQRTQTDSVTKFQTIACPSTAS